MTENISNTLKGLKIKLADLAIERYQHEDIWEVDFPQDKKDMLNELIKTTLSLTNTLKMLK
jgi:hypothetical protein